MRSYLVLSLLLCPEKCGCLEAVSKSCCRACIGSSKRSLGLFGDEAVAGVAPPFRVASQYAVAYEVVDVPLGVVLGASGYAGPFGGG